MRNHDAAPQAPADRDDHRPYVVGIGASAGGIEALQEFFHRVAPDSGAAERYARAVEKRDAIIRATR